jgi:hypothetical protein
MEEVAVIMKIACESWMQDWPIEVADGNRLEEFLEYCERENRPEHGAIMAEILLASLDDAFLRRQPDGFILERAAKIFAKNPKLLEYWRRPDAASEEEMFAVTPWVRSLTIR